METHPVFIHCTFCLNFKSPYVEEVPVVFLEKVFRYDHLSLFQILCKGKVSVIFSLIDDLYIREEMPLKYITLLLELIKMKRKVDIRHRNILVYSWNGNVREHWKAIPIIVESRMACLYFAISSQGKVARWLNLMAQTLLLNGLALGLLTFVILQYIWMLFPNNSLSQWLCLLPGPASSSIHDVHTHKFIKSPSTPGQPNLAPEEDVQMLNPEGWS